MGPLGSLAMASPRDPARSSSEVPTSLVRNLGLFGAIAVSLAVVGPSMSVSLNPQAMAEQVGGAVPLVYVMALVPMPMLSDIALAIPPASTITNECESTFTYTVTQLAHPDNSLIITTCNQV